jgi:hypothetical protein
VETVVDDSALAARIEDERKRAATLDDTIAAQLTNILIAGSVGAIVASVTFLKDIAPQPVAGSLQYVKFAWALLFLTSVFSIASLLTSRATGKSYRNWLGALKDEKESARLKKRCDIWNRWTKVLQILGMVFLASGAALLLYFAYLNLPSEREAMNEKGKKVHTGVPPDTSTKPEKLPTERPTKQPGEKKERAYDFDTTNPFLKQPENPKAKPKE